MRACVDGDDVANDDPRPFETIARHHCRCAPGDPLYNWIAADFALRSDLMDLMATSDDGDDERDCAPAVHSELTSDGVRPVGNRRHPTHAKRATDAPSVPYSAEDYCRREAREQELADQDAEHLQQLEAKLGRPLRLGLGGEDPHPLFHTGGMPRDSLLSHVRGVSHLESRKRQSGRGFSLAMRVANQVYNDSTSNAGVPQLAPSSEEAESQRALLATK